MATFPAIIPSSRTFTPGQYPHSVFAGMNGVQSRVRNSNVMLGSQVRLAFAAIPEDQMLLILNHYKSRGGTYLSFPLPLEVWNAVSSAVDYQLVNYGWRYVEAPTVEDSMCANAYNVAISLETVPPEGTALLGLNSIVRLRLAAGTAQASNGFNLTVTASIEYGAAAASGLAETVTATFAAGAFSADGTIFSDEQSILWVLTPGNANGVDTDPNFADVLLLLHMDGSNGSTTFTDSSNGTLAVTANGNAQISTAQSKFGGASGLFDGSGDFLSTVITGGLGSGDFTIEMWFYALASGLFLFNTRTSGTSGDGIDMLSDGRISTSFSVIVSTSLSYSLNTWNHLAVTRSGSTVTRWLNGTAEGTGSNGGNWSGADFRIGGNNYASGNIGYFNGYIDDARITKGVARYTASFTPPTAPFPDS